ncbi:hypothetical protein [Anaerosoma tenue]|uniref:hypothetical protein n=1 Tax=Anaerosoma tenue TaxID=2933588 RepID=UPI002260F863|nr:hypothetical protein [Anaerosoma tenue]MCK8115431.1 hypothetical protein [Anaerosoma tenue]
MRPLIRVVLIALVVVFSASLAACATGGGTASSGDLVADERPVPDGMPVMYEFFTTS